MTAIPPVHDLLAARARRSGGAPLLTHYRPASGERVELSATSLANWADKAANLLDGLGVDEGSEVALPVLVERPASWMGLVLPLACWQRGVGVRVVPREEASGADLVVIGPDAPGPVGFETLACSLHPWGLALPGMPDGVTDFSSSAMAEPDAHGGVPAQPSAVAWLSDARDVTFAGLRDLEPLDERVLLTPDDPWEAVSTVWRAASGQGSVVLVDGSADADQLARIAHDERAVRF